MSKITTTPRFTIGMRANWKGQQFEMVGVQDYVRKNGTNTDLPIWESRCMVCDVPFQTIGPRRWPLNRPTRCCPAHRMTRPMHQDAIKPHEAKAMACHLLHPDFPTAAGQTLPALVKMLEPLSTSNVYEVMAATIVEAHRLLREMRDLCDESRVRAMLDGIEQLNASRSATDTVN